MSSVPNYVGTSSQVEAEQDIDYAGPNVHANIAPSVDTSGVHAQDPRTFVYPVVSMDPMQKRQHTWDSVQQFNTMQDQMYKKNQLLDFNPAFDPGTLDRPTFLDMEAEDPVNTYAENILRHSASFNLKIMRGPN
jgi:hypothetical protein